MKLQSFMKQEALETPAMLRREAGRLDRDAHAANGIDRRRLGLGIVVMAMPVMGMMIVSTATTAHGWPPSNDGKVGLPMMGRSRFFEKA